MLHACLMTATCMLLVCRHSFPQSGLCLSLYSNSLRRLTWSAGVNGDLPWIMLLVGANCYSQDYRFLEEQLAGRGYLIAVADEVHPVTASAPFASRNFSTESQTSIHICVGYAYTSMLCIWSYFAVTCHPAGMQQA